MDKMTLDNYLSAVSSDVTNKQKYQSRYNSIRNKIKSEWYKLDDVTIVVLTIPSEKAKLVNYQVILEFTANAVETTSRNLFKTEMKVYSNCPSFVFMNAKLFEEKGFLVTWAKELYDPAVFANTEEAKVEQTAPATKKDVRCEKSLYYAALYIKDMSAITVLSHLDKATTIKDTKSILWRIKDSNKMLKQRQKSAKFNRPKKSDDKKPQEKVPKHTVSAVSKVKSVNKIKHI